MKSSSFGLIVLLPFLPSPMCSGLPLIIQWRLRPTVSLATTLGDAQLLNTAQDVRCAAIINSNSATHAKPTPAMAAVVTALAVASASAKDPPAFILIITTSAPTGCHLLPKEQDLYQSREEYGMCNTSCGRNFALQFSVADLTFGSLAQPGVWNPEQNQA
jgi:hypothetical protein